MSPLRIFGQALALLVLSCAAGAARPSIEFAAPTVETVAPEIRQTGWVTDAAEILHEAVEQNLAARLADFERRTGHQMVVVTVPTLSGRDVTEVADHLGNTWGVGREGYNDGVVMLVAPNERRMRISTAAGITQLLSDEVCREIIEETMIPRFREGDLEGGIMAGTDAIIAHFD